MEKKKALDGMRLLTVPQVREVLSVSTSTVYQLMAKGELAHTKIGGCRRIREESVMALIERGTTEGVK